MKIEITESYQLESAQRGLEAFFLMEKGKVIKYDNTESLPNSFVLTIGEEVWDNWKWVKKLYKDLKKKKTKKQSKQIKAMRKDLYLVGRDHDVSFTNKEVRQFLDACFKQLKYLYDE